MYGTDQWTCYSCGCQCKDIANSWSHFNTPTYAAWCKNCAYHCNKNGGYPCGSDQKITDHLAEHGMIALRMSTAIACGKLIDSPMAAQVKAEIEKIHNDCVCKLCKTANPFAQPNRPNNEYVCYNCRN